MDGADSSDTLHQSMNAEPQSWPANSDGAALFLKDEKDWPWATAESFHEALRLAIREFAQVSTASFSSLLPGRSGNLHLLDPGC